MQFSQTLNSFHNIFSRTIRGGLQSNKNIFLSISGKLDGVDTLGGLKHLGVLGISVLKKLKCAGALNLS